MSVLSKPYFHCEEAAFAHLESILWADGVVCPHCGSVSGRHYDLRKTRIGLRKCSDCRRQFTVKVGTVFESAHIPLHKMLQAVYLMTASKKGISAHQLHRVLEITYKSAWFLAHRIREAMRSGDLAPVGGEGKTVEVDETYFGDKDVITKRTKRGKASHSSKRSVVALVERGGEVRSFHAERADKATVNRIVGDNIARETDIRTDESRLYADVASNFASHETARHASGEYVRGDVHTNTIEGYFSIFKRGMKGVYQHCGEKHLHRYLAEFDFRYNNRVALGCHDGERATRAMSGIVGKRLTYRRADCEAQ
jgi:transposase-like protein